MFRLGKTAPSTTSWQAAGSRRLISRAHGRSRRRICRPTSKGSRSSISAHASWRRCRHRPGRRSRAARANPADSARQQESSEGAGRRVPGRSQVRADREDDGRARREHRQGRLQGRRSYYMCYQGVWFVSKSASGPWEVASSVPQQIYEIPVSSPANHVTYVTVEDSDDEWVTYAAAAGYTGMMIGWGCAVWGSGWYYPPYYGYGGYYPYYYPYSRPTGTPLGTTPIPARTGAAPRYTDRTAARVLARATTLALAPTLAVPPPRSLWRSGRGASVQPANGHVRSDATGIQRLRELGLDVRPARRRLGQDQPLHQPDDRQHHSHDPDRRGWRDHSARRSWRRRLCRWRRGRQRVCRPGRQRLQTRWWYVAEIRQRWLVQHGPSARRRIGATARSLDQRAAAEHDGQQHPRPTRSRRGGAARRLTAHKRLRKLSKRQRHPQHRQLSRRQQRLPRRRAWRWPTPLMSGSGGAQRFAWSRGEILNE